MERAMGIDPWPTATKLLIPIIHYRWSASNGASA